MRASEFTSKRLSPGQWTVDAILDVVPMATEIWFHGSRAIGKHKRTSDTDILVVVPDEFIGESYLKILRILQKLSSQYKDYDIQPTHANTNIHRIAQEEGKLLYKKQDITEQVSAKHIFDLAKKIHRRLDDFSDGDLTDRIYWFDEYTLTDLPVSKINIHEFDVDEDLVAKHIAKIMKSTDTMPPIIYDPIAKSIIDGIHRVNAYKKLGYKTIPAYVGSKKSDSYGQSETYESITEGTAHPCIVVDVQPEYCGINDGDENHVCVNVIEFINQRTGPVLMFVNAEDQGLSGDTVNDIKQYWQDTGFDPNNWRKVEIVDKGYGYFRSWMDRGTSPRTIIKVIREMYNQKVSDSRELYGGELDPNYEENMRKLMGSDFRAYDLDDSISVNWTSVAQLKRYNGAYIMGGGREECLREVELLMNAFNIKYRRIDSLVYG